MTMKTLNGQKIHRKFRSVSEQHLQKAKTSPRKLLLFKINENDKNSTCFRPKFLKPRSESCINTNLIAVKKPPASNESSTELQLIPSPKTPKHPKEVLRRSLIKLRSAQLNESVSALRDIVQISRFNPQLLAKSMHIIYKGIIVLLKSLKTTAARTACQAANELFMNTPADEGPELVQLAHVLLQKSVDTNECLRKDALEALDTMVIHVPPVQSIKILLHRRIADYGLNVRTTASKLLACVLSDSDSSAFLNEDTKTRLVFAAMKFLQDDCHDIKFHGVRLMTTLMHHKDFDKIFQTKISTAMLNRINKIVETVKSTLKLSNS